MPSPYLISFSKESGIPINDLLPKWEEAKKITSEMFGKAEENFEDKDYRFSVETLKRMSGLDENFLDPMKFVESGKDAKAYVEGFGISIKPEDAVVSGDFNIGSVVHKHPVQSTKPEEEPEEEEPSEKSYEEIFGNVFEQREREQLHRENAEPNPEQGFDSMFDGLVPKNPVKKRK